MKKFYVAVERELDDMVRTCNLSPLNCLREYRDGFSVFVDLPQVPMNMSFVQVVDLVESSLSSGKHSPTRDLSANYF